MFEYERPAPSHPPSGSGAQLFLEDLFRRAAWEREHLGFGELPSNKAQPVIQPKGAAYVEE